MNFSFFLGAAALVFLPLCAMPAIAQENNAAQPQSFARRFENGVFRQSVTPHWLKGGNSFWYRVTTAPGRAEFVFVDALKGQRRAAFDHQKLALSLSRELQSEVRPDALPFTWIQSAPDAAWVRFRAAGKVWQFDRDGTLQPSSQPLSEEKSAPLRDIRPSRAGGEATSLSFVNQTQSAVSLFWIDTAGQAIGYGTIAAGATLNRSTYVGHIWQVRGENDQVLGVYEATEDEKRAVIEAVGITKPTSAPAAAPAARVPPQPQTRPAAPTVRGVVRNFNLWLRDAAGQETPLTTDGASDNFYRQRLQISPDGRFGVAWQVKPAQEHPVHLVESSPRDGLQPRLKTIDYLKPGDRIEQERPRLFDLQTRREIPTSDELFRNPWSIEELGWSEDAQKFRFLFNQRGHQNLRLLEMNRAGQVRALIEEHSDTFVDYSQKTYFHTVPGRNELLWASERDGWNHLYLVDLASGRVKNQITKGNWVMREVVRVDDQKRQIWFRALGLVPGQDPYYAQLARINFDGSGLQMLTEGDGTHRWKWSPDNRFLVDTFSRVDMAPVTQLRNAETGRLICALETSSVQNLTASGWTLPERFTAMGRDGKTPIYGIIVRPSHFDAARKYPVIEQIYAGPQDFFVPKAFESLANQRELAELGFIVVQIDGMGTNWRSKAFHDVAYKNLKDAGFPDRINWLKTAAQTRPWLDLSRVGIYGGSAGGQNALGALLWHGDFYKAAAADCGCHDNRMDKIWWNEAWMGWPVDGSYEDSSNVVHAKNLRGDLLLIVGELDTNVDPASTMQVVDALIKADKDFDLLVVPGAGHGAGSSPYGRRRQRDFFVRHLLGIEARHNGGLSNQ